MPFLEQLYTPGEKTPFGKPQIVNFDQNISDAWKEIQAQRRKLQAQLNHVNKEAEQTKVNAIAMLIDDCDIDEYIDKLSKLRVEAEVLQGAINYLNNQADALKRGNPWLGNQ